MTVVNLPKRLNIEAGQIWIGDLEPEITYALYFDKPVEGAQIMAITVNGSVVSIGEINGNFYKQKDQVFLDSHRYRITKVYAKVTKPGLYEIYGYTGQRYDANHNNDVC